MTALHKPVVAQRTRYNCYKTRDNTVYSSLRRLQQRGHYSLQHDDVLGRPDKHGMHHNHGLSLVMSRGPHFDTRNRPNNGQSVSR